MIKIIAISDTHNYGYPTGELPDADIIVHAGDACLQGTLAELTRHANWLENCSYKYPHVIYVPGNHDHAFNGGAADDHARTICELAPNIHILLNQFLTIKDEQTGNNLLIYGSPVTPPVGWDWHYYYSDRQREQFWHQNIQLHAEKKPDVLITHGPPYRIADKLALKFAGDRHPHVGCRGIRHYVENIEPRLHVFGHIHEQYGVYEAAAFDVVNPDGKLVDTVFVNASHRDENYHKGQSPWLITIEALGIPGDENTWTVTGIEPC